MFHTDLFVITDEIFSQVIYDGGKDKTISSIPGMKDGCIVIDAWSKTYAMTGWRIGFAVANEEIITKLSIFLQDSITNVAAFIQRAAYEAVTGPQDWTYEKRELLQHKRNLMVKGLNEVPGIKCITPPGSFYCFPDITGTGLSSQELTDRLVEEAGVAVVAGTAFGTQGEGFVRITYAVHDDDIHEGIERMKKFFSK